VTRPPTDLAVTGSNHEVTTTVGIVTALIGTMLLVTARRMGPQQRERQREEEVTDGPAVSL